MPNIGNMVIASSNIGFEATHYSASRVTESLSFRIVNDSNSDNRDILDIKSAGSSQMIPKTDDNDNMLSAEMRAIKMLFREIFGDKFDIHLSDYSKAESSVNSMNEEIRERTGADNFELSRAVSVYESEKISLNASGIIKTSDGQEIDFKISFSLGREFYMENVQQIRSARKSDPLVLNLDTTAADLSSQKVAFDINSDGTDENISIPSSGSAFLFIDKDDDGRATDGSELFGPSSGSGFNELRLHDIDGNNWIDENDEVFNKLKLWNAATGSMSALRDRGIGAIYLNSTNTPFSYKPDYETENGFLRRTGIYVREDGSVSTIQELDLSI